MPEWTPSPDFGTYEADPSSDVVEGGPPEVSSMPDLGDWDAGVPDIDPGPDVDPGPDIEPPDPFAPENLPPWLDQSPSEGPAPEAGSDQEPPDLDSSLDQERPDLDFLNNPVNPNRPVDPPAVPSGDRGHGRPGGGRSASGSRRGGSGGGGGGGPHSGGGSGGDGGGPDPGHGAAFTGEYGDGGDGRAPDRPDPGLDGGDLDVGPPHGGETAADVPGADSQEPAGSSGHEPPTTDIDTEDGVTTVTITSADGTTSTIEFQEYMAPYIDVSTGWVTGSDGETSAGVFVRAPAPGMVNAQGGLPVHEQYVRPAGATVDFAIPEPQETMEREIHDGITTLTFHAKDGSSATVSFQEGMERHIEVNFREETTDGRTVVGLAVSAPAAGMVAVEAPSGWTVHESCGHGAPHVPGNSDQMPPAAPAAGPQPQPQPQTQPEPQSDGWSFGDVKARAAHAAEAVRDQFNESVAAAKERLHETFEAARQDPAGTAAKLAAEGLSHLGTSPPTRLADDLVDTMAGAAEKFAPAPPATGGTPLPDIDPAPRLQSDTVLDGAREVRDVITDPDASVATKLAVSPLFAAALVAAGLEQFVANPIMGTPADIVDAAQLFAKAEAHLARGEYRQAAACLHEANAKIEQAAMVLLDIASLGESAAVGGLAREAHVASAEARAASAESRMAGAEARAEAHAGAEARVADGPRERSLSDEVADEFRQQQERAEAAGDLKRDVREHAEGRRHDDLTEAGRIDELDPGHDRTWEPEHRIHLPAANKGEWLDGAVPGNGRWQPHRPAELGLDPGDSIPFREDTPDLTEFAVETPAGEPGTFSLDGMTFDRAQDFRLADEQLGARCGMTGKEFAQWRADHRLTYHHYVGDELQLVPQLLHNGLHHQGSVAEKVGERR